MIKQDCFGYKFGECKIMLELICAKRKCSSYKTEEQFKRDMKKL